MVYQKQHVESRENAFFIPDLYDNGTKDKGQFIVYPVESKIEPDDDIYIDFQT